MTMQNLAIVFGPTLFGQLPLVNGHTPNSMADAPLQNLVRESAIFIPRHFLKLIIIRF